MTTGEIIGRVENRTLNADRGKKKREIRRRVWGRWQMENGDCWEDEDRWRNRKRYGKNGNVTRRIKVHGTRNIKTGARTGDIRRSMIFLKAWESSELIYHCIIF